ncbi:beta-lactamase superfamily domain-containing protein, partial [Geopyxis carbonaria]
SKAHHRANGKGFQNPWDSWVELGLGKIAKGFLSYRLKHGLRGPSTKERDIGGVVTPSFSATRSISSTEFRATWLGHACYYVEFPGGLRVLFDPVFSQRCSPVQFMGPKRYARLPCEIAEIPAVDIVCISHNHYDHLDQGTIRKLKKHHPNAWYFVPLGNKSWFNTKGIENCIELDWWQSRDVNLNSTEPRLESKTEPGTSPKSRPHESTETTAVVIEFLPCQHTSNRGFNDRAATLWGSWRVQSGGKNLYFAGDTGYRAVPRESEGKDDYGEEYASLPVCPAFTQIGELRGPFDVGLIPIGAYVPRWWYSPMHASPKDAVNIFVDTRCKRALGMHWGTFVLTDEPVLEPVTKLLEALKEKGIAERGVFDVPGIGDS